ncbi:SemiSWEET family transporter [Erythrobacter tepidarius]|uniref:SemiSWEET family transporter n=1 Tax=Erythrobacter tepidarius TaxID=60454 RepID=UPI000A370FCC|nr:SemiSWEET family transporter [Erythrobacter tepidarius]
MLAGMTLFHALVLLHVVTGAVGLTAFWGPIVTRKGAANHRKWGKTACYGFLGAGGLAIAMALLSLYGPEVRHPEVTDRALFDGLFGWMMLYLGALTMGFVDYGLAVVKHARNRRALRAIRYQAVIAAVVVSGAWCGIYGARVSHPLMVLVAVIGIVAMAIQQRFIWRATDFPRGTHIGEHFRALIGMGISAYTAFLSVGLIRLVPEHVFNPAIWAGPSVIGVSLILYFTLKAKRAPAPRASGVRPHPQQIGDGLVERQ